ncbi:G patch domain-containing protein 3-like [Uloborus diversus]|uniref:G patch domain-containing protein 3-like n=1 Tax=Uloborus diversus TaxID=327109 RepID=UPI002409DF60|nr:G patch domain-containing protein 3-like [Uloborus diversus]
MAASFNEDGVFVIINNIPKDYHASDLRNFFSSFTETGGFLIFHYRHRPEVQKPIEPSENETEQSRCVTHCGIAKVVRNRVDEFIKSYNKEHWLNKNGETLCSRCFIKKIAFTDCTDSEIVIDFLKTKRGTVGTNVPLNKETFTKQDLTSLIELHPPICMPNGNVGTKTSYFLEQIKACRLPPSLISRLGLQFPRNRARRIYGNVPLEYQKGSRKQPSISKWKDVHSRGKWSFQTSSELRSKHKDDEKNSESEGEEEWDRHEALHDDVTGQERTKERLFEEKIELKWEKGGSGLVFYTDAQFWDAKAGDFDEKTADDWDVDTSIYTEPPVACDKDARDLARMRQEKALREGKETDIDMLYDFAAFEKHNKGFGRKILEAQGWKQGQGIGRNCSGIPEPLSNDGQKPFDKKGFGYRGEKLDRRPTIKRNKRRRVSDDYETFSISTVYDNPNETDPPDSILNSSAFSRLKYRKEFLKEHFPDL